MWICGKCGAEVNDQFTLCGWCGTTSDGIEDPTFAAESIPAAAQVAENTPLETVTLVEAPVAEVLSSETAAATAVAEPPPALIQMPIGSPPSGPVWEPENKASLNANEYVRVLESKLSSLMDDFDTPDWKVNPAFHPEVNAFIQGHAANAAFVKRAQTLQPNRAKYYATMRAQGKKTVAETPAVVAPVAPAVEMPVVETFPAFAPPPVEAKTKPQRSRLRRTVAWTTVSLLLLVGGTLAYVVYGRMSGDQQLHDVIAWIEETDASWRWEDLQAARAEVPEEKNAAGQVKAADESLKDWSDDGAVAKGLVALEPPIRLTHEQREQLYEELKARTRALAEARALDRYATGRFPATPLDQRGGPTLPAVSARRVADLLRLDAIFRAQDRDIAGALSSARAALVAVRTISDEPITMCQLGRTGTQSRVCSIIERTLAQGQAREEALAATQALLEDEAAQPLLWIALRGDRAFYQEMMERLAAGDAAALIDGDDEPSPFVTDTEYYGVETWVRGGEIRASQAQGLRLLTEAVAAARRPVEEQVEGFKELEKRGKALLADDPFLRSSKGSAAFMLVVDAKAPAFHRALAELRCTVTALAIERYRLATGEWPESLDQLGRFLPTVPLDPYDGKPLRLRKLSDGVVLYSIGPDGEDNAGSLADRKTGTLQGKDIAFRLWDTDRRRQPPKEAQKPDA